MSVFVRQAFYIQPPEKNAPVEMWNKWLVDDKKKAIQAKREFTKKNNSGEGPSMSLDVVTKKVNGIYKQVPSVGFSGSDGDFSVEPAVEATQELSLEQARFEIKARGCSHQRNGSEKRKARRLRRRQKREGLL